MLLHYLRKQETHKLRLFTYMLHAFSPKNTKQLKMKYHLVRAEPPFTVKTIDCVHQTGPREEHSILLSVTPMLCVSQVCHGVIRYAKGESYSSSSLE